MARPVPDLYGVIISVGREVGVGDTGLGVIRIGATDIEGFVGNPDRDLSGDTIAGALVRDDRQFITVDEALAAIRQENIKRITSFAEVAIAIGKGEGNGQGVGKSRYIALGDDVLVGDSPTFRNGYLRLNWVIRGLDAIV